MVIKSPHPRLDLPECNLLDYLFPSPSAPAPSPSCEPAVRPNIDDNEPIWLDAANPETQSLTAPQMELWVKRFGYGVGKLGVKRGEVVLIFTPNHIYVPVAYMGTVGAGMVFSGANPMYKEDGTFHIQTFPPAVGSIDSCINFLSRSVNTPGANAEIGRTIVSIIRACGSTPDFSIGRWCIHTVSVKPQSPQKNC